MRHGKGIKKLGRTGPHRRATLRNMAAALIEHERIETTDAKAKALRSFVEKLVTLGKRGDLHARRMASVHVRDRDLLKKLKPALNWSILGSCRYMMLVSSRMVGIFIR